MRDKFEDRFWNTVLICAVIGAVATVVGAVIGVIWLINHIQFI